MKTLNIVINGDNHYIHIPENLDLKHMSAAVFSAAFHSDNVTAEEVNILEVILNVIEML